MKFDKKFAVVEFTADHTTALVPTGWIKNARCQENSNGESFILAKCYWPKKDIIKNNVYTLVKKCVEPKGSGWDLLDAVVDEQFDSYDIGRRALVDFSDGAATGVAESGSESDKVVSGEVIRPHTSRKRKSKDDLPDQDSDGDDYTLPDVSSLDANSAEPKNKSTKSTKSPSKSSATELVRLLKDPTRGNSKSPGKSTATAVVEPSPKKTGDCSTSARGGPIMKFLTAPTTNQFGALSPPKTFVETRVNTPRKKSSETSASQPQPSSSRSPLLITSVTPGKKKRPESATSHHASPTSAKAMKMDSTSKNTKSTKVAEPHRCSPGFEDIDMDMYDNEDEPLAEDLDNISLASTPSFNDDTVFKTPGSSASKRSLTFSFKPAKASGESVLNSVNGRTMEMSTQLSMIRSIVTEIRNGMTELRNSTKDSSDRIAKILSCVQPPLESNIAEDIPYLPLQDGQSEKKFSDMLKDKEKFNKTVSYLYSLGGLNAHDGVYMAMKTLYSDKLASTKSMKGIQRTDKPKKDAFLGTMPFKAVMCAVRKRFQEATVAEIYETMGNWLRDAPAREKKRQSRLSRREERDRDLEDVDGIFNN